MANWNWRLVNRFVWERCGISLSRSSCLNWLHRLGFAFKRPKKRLLKADEAKRESFVVEYAALMEEACQSNAKIFFADEAHFRADAELRGKWVLRGEPALVDSSSPRYGGEGQLLFGGVLGDRRGGVDGTGREQQLRNIGSFPGAVAGEALRAAERDLGQCPGPPRRGGAGVSPDAGTEPTAGEPARATARISTLMRPSGAGRERRPWGICAWGQCRRSWNGSAAS